MPGWVTRKLWTPKTIRETLGYSGPIAVLEHHISHAASTFYPSPFEEAAIITIDGVGEWATTSWGVGKDAQLQLTHQIDFPHSLGLFYSEFTYFLGFKVNCDEYKVMGLAPYGTPRFASTILDNLIDLSDDGAYRLNMKYFEYCTNLTMVGEAFETLFGISRRCPGSTLAQHHMDLAASAQKVLETVVLKTARHVRRETGLRHLCLAGGVALNCVANGKLLAEGIFDNIWIQPAAGDAGCALGAALHTWHHLLRNPRSCDGVRDRQNHSLLGLGYSNEDLHRYLLQNEYLHTTLSDEELPVRVARLIEQQNVIGWFQGRFEFGPRALGSRSILADPRSEGMPNILNRKIKNREAFRPFAPIVKREVVSDYFEIDADSPYMLLVAPVRRERRKAVSAEQLQRFGPDLLNVARSDLPAVTHVDYSARLQTVTRQSNPRLYSLLDAFQESTEYPVLINTSFNVRDEPVVNSPVEAYRCFMQTAMDALVLGNHLLEKKQQNVLYHELKVSFKESDDDFVIAVLGESTAYGLPYGPSINIASLASFALAGEVDGRKIRVLNLAKPGQPSAGVLKGIKQLPRKVDVVLLYCGQNEFYAQHLYPHDLTCSQRRLVDVPLQSSRKRRRTIEQFESNITRIINECTARGAKVVISTFAQNLARRWPNRSTIKNRRHASQVETLFQQGEHLASHGDHDAAAVVMQEILQMEPGFAAAHKLLGDCFLATKRYGEAIRAYEASVTHDAFPSIGIDEQNEIIRRLAAI